MKHPPFTVCCIAGPSSRNGPLGPTADPTVARAVAKEAAAKAEAPKVSTHGITGQGLVPKMLINDDCIMDDCIIVSSWFQNLMIVQWIVNDDEWMTNND